MPDIRLSGVPAIMFGPVGFKNATEHLIDELARAGIRLGIVVMRVQIRIGL